MKAFRIPSGVSETDVTQSGNSANLRKPRLTREKPSRNRLHPVGEVLTTMKLRRGRLIYNASGEFVKQILASEIECKQNPIG